MNTTRVRLIILFAALGGILPYTESPTNAMPSSFYPYLSSLMPDTAENNPSCLWEVSAIQFSFGEIVNHNRDSIDVKSNGSFLARKYLMEPTDFPAPQRNTHFFPFYLGWVDYYEGWLWEADFSLAAMNGFKFRQAYYFINSETHTMDIIDLSVRELLQLYRFRAKLGRRISPHLILAAAPVAYTGFHKLETDKIYTYDGSGGEFENYVTDFYSIHQGYAPGLQLGMWWQNPGCSVRSYLEYDYKLRLSGTTNLDQNKLHDEMSIRMPLKSETTIEAPVDDVSIVQFTAAFEYFGGTIYQQLPERLDLPPHSIGTSMVAGVGWIYKVNKPLTLAAGYRFYDLPRDSSYWQYTEMSGNLHELSGRAACRLGDFFLNAGGSFFLKQGDGRFPSTYQLSFSVSYLLE